MKQEKLKIKRTAIENTLFDMGISAGIKGFTYITDAIEIISEKGIDIGVTKGLYPEIAEMQKTTPSCVERAIRHAFEIARGEKGDYETVNHYIGFVNCTNSASLMRFYLMLKREETSLEKGGVNAV